MLSAGSLLIQSLLARGLIVRSTNALRLIVLSLTVLSVSAQAAIDVQEFESESQREQYQKIIDELRCPKCKNQNLSGTNSQIAMDLRREVHQMVLDGKSEEHIVDFMVSRYGDFVLYRPRVQGNTLLLWYGPLVMFLLAAGIVGAIVWKRSRANAKAADLSETEQERLRNMMSKIDDAALAGNLPEGAADNDAKPGDKSNESTSQ